MTEHNYIISGIQQVGIGVSNVHEAFKWYNQRFGMDIPIFEEAATAELMLPYTGGRPHQRHAILAINIKGGGGFEIWQYTSRTPVKAGFEIRMGDLGIFCAKIKTDNIGATYEELKSSGTQMLGEITRSITGKKHFFVMDPWSNLFEIIEDEHFFSKGLRHTGGPAGVMIGVSDLSKSIRFYSEILGYDQVLAREDNKTPDDLGKIPGGTRKCSRAVLTHSKERKGPFAPLLGRSYIELIQLHDETPRKIFENRFWGDLGYIHLCFDIKNMAGLKQKCEQFGQPFTVDGGAGFEMGEAAGHFTYIEDPDGTLIEFVETKKIPIMKKFGWYLDLRKKDPERSLPRWMLKALQFNRKKFS